MTIAIVDLDVGNCGSIAHVLKKLRTPSIVTSDPDVIKNAQKIILPGVGAFDTVAAAVDRLDLRETLVQIAQAGEQPLLGICVGMQILAEGSEEGKLPGLGIIPGYCRRFSDPTLRVPHMGWNQLSARSGSPLFTYLNAESRFYFVHSYYVETDDESHIAATTAYGLNFASAVQINNVYGVQFHPEKSHRHGLALFKAFLEI
jgi:glutamine amidotransferase